MTTGYKSLPYPTIAPRTSTAPRRCIHLGSGHEILQGPRILESGTEEGSIKGAENEVFPIQKAPKSSTIVLGRFVVLSIWQYQSWKGKNLCSLIITFSFSNNAKGFFDLWIEELLLYVIKLCDRNAGISKVLHLIDRALRMIGWNSD